MENNNSDPRNLWWGYLHTSGTIQAKRYFGKQDIDEAFESLFCDIVYGPFPADNREEAIHHLQEQFKQDKI